VILENRNSFIAISPPLRNRMKKEGIELVVVEETRSPLPPESPKPAHEALAKKDPLVMLALYNIISGRQDNRSKCLTSSLSTPNGIYNFMYRVETTSKETDVAEAHRVLVIAHAQPQRWDSHTLFQRGHQYQQATSLTVIDDKFIVANGGVLDEGHVPLVMEGMEPELILRLQDIRRKYVQKGLSEIFRDYKRNM